MNSHTSRVRHRVPWLLLSVRVVITPVLLIGSHRLGDRAVLWLYLLAFTTDYLDGAVARRLGVATRRLRIADSSADVVFHLALAYVLVLHHPEAFRQSAAALVAFAITTVAWYLLDLLRWRRLAGFHTLSAKLLSVGLMVWIVLLLTGTAVPWLLSAVLILGSVSNAEGIAISLTLRQDRTDVWWIGELWRSPGPPEDSPQRPPAPLRNPPTAPR